MFGCRILGIEAKWFQESFAEGYHGSKSFIMRFTILYLVNWENVVKIPKNHCSPFGTFQLIKRQSCHHVETNQLICIANQLPGFYMKATFAFNELMLTSLKRYQYFRAWNIKQSSILTQLLFTCTKSTMETSEQSMKFGQTW